ncbi:ABC-F family ATP-binding cassette domain-containing protein [Hominiventricola filiformis]|uniref:ABC-F family ATP-binding cassette domain-containing protein n=1 Tax=Hominiventricola filiformis TaxID=2885352 RepID=A0AAE3DBB9_9FIRM|nr:ABC-F family ATP-binding cassette domain-containing protein [Hominiventricola filiformis]MCC2126140.1 ABC-F family ATP-binding cassette domain-containing protein [Hominiventricola filiformis]
MILACQNICKAFGDNEVLKNASFHIEEREKAAIVGINGAGKSTLLKIIIGEMAADDGQTVINKGATIGYLAQHQEMQSGNTIFDELLTVKQDVLDLEARIRSMELSMKQAEGAELQELMDQYARLSHEFEQKNGYAWKSEITGVLKGLGFTEEDFSKHVDTLSGGQKTRVSLGKLLLSKPDIIMLDEPTNHLDMGSITWLETFLMNYQGAVLIVSHDRYFLNRVVTKVIEIDQGQVTTFMGNYSDYAQKKAMLREAQMQAYLNQQREIKHQEEVIAKLKSFNREKSIKRAESREKMLDKLDVLDKPSEVKADMHIELEPRVVSGNDVLTVLGLSKAFPPQTLFTDLDFEIKRGERVALIGSNGTGKTTILKILNQVIPADAGEVHLGSRVQIGYYDQEHHVLHMEKTVFEELSDAYPTLTNTKIRNVLAAFLFTGDDVFKRIKDLSGGERGRVSLAKLMLSEANFLILDEPTNHLDIVSKEVLEDALNHYTGTVLFVSHDRYFINTVATRILDLENQGLTNYIGNYDYYLEKKETMVNFTAAPTETVSAAETTADTDSKLDWKQQKEQQAQLRKKQNELKKVESRIEELENRDKEIDAELEKKEVFTNVAEVTKLSKEKDAIQTELEELYEKWEELSE